MPIPFTPDDPSFDDSDGAPARGEGEGLLRDASESGRFVGGFTGMENVAADEITLRNYLISQINIDLEDPTDIMIAGRLMEMLDDNAWLSG